MLKPNHEKFPVEEGGIILENAKNRKFCKISSDSMIFRTQKYFDRIRHGRFNNTVKDRIILIINLLGQKWAIFTVPDPNYISKRFAHFALLSVAEATQSNGRYVNEKLEVRDTIFIINDVHFKNKFCRYTTSKLKKVKNGPKWLFSSSY